MNDPHPPIPDSMAELDADERREKIQAFAKEVGIPFDLVKAAQAMAAVQQEVDSQAGPQTLFPPPSPEQLQRLKRRGRTILVLVTVGRFLVIFAAVTAALLVAGCASPFIATVESDARVFLAFDGAVVVAATDGAGAFTVTVKGSSVPLYARALAPGTVLVARIVDPEYHERVAAGGFLSPAGLAVALTILSETQIETLRLAPPPIP